MNDIYSFYQLISKYQIEIPIIQRDYAQGRNNPKAADVRKSLVDNMIKAVKEDKPLFFDFVYGRVDNNKFIPFDGQQRLTTLFLFHKYVFEKCQSDLGCNHKDNCSCGGILGRFSYATRQSSREFCEKLVQEKIILGNSLTDNIKNQSWFYPDWEKDPTVMGMLTMLDEIHCQMRNETEFKTFAEKLTSGCNCPITFHFVDMGEHKMSDETYVKMNARGKTLTPFENFKASLEQYLEGKSKSDDISVELQNKYKNLLSRLNGEYNEDLQKYTGIDGSWLDLFWNINGNVLPDTLMMSFFNRHFMNIWRSWYANNSKSEKKDEYDAFNTRIQKEMPLYPTKDDFVSFEIYSYVMDNCGVEDCLYPIFNIWDALCKKDNSILNDCQAVWNRKEEGPKWNLYQGDKNKDNRETYPSRVAFYALLRFFGVENEESKTTLSQWMRIVWNIIENSTIDSPDTYQAALRLIDNLSEKCHDIHDALANHFGDFELGSQYHAQEQVKEEIAKAKQILNGEQRSDGKTWEEIIIEAERYAFFKGAIRFLFQNAEGKVTEDSWELFDNKWENAQEYFDKDGVKDGNENDKLYKSNALLMKSLLANCDNFGGKIWGHFEFSNDAIRWKRILTSNNWIAAVDAIMGTEITDVVTSKFIDEINNPDIKNIVDDGLMDYVCNNMSGAWIRSTYHGYHAIWQSGYPASQVVLNPILSKLQFEGKISYRNTEGRDSTIPNCRYYRCFDKNVDFKYKFNDKYYYFNWWGNFRWGIPNETELDVYLTEDNWNDYKKRPNPTSDKGTDEDIYYCFRVTKDMESDPSKFTDALDELIKKLQIS